MTRSATLLTLGLLAGACSGDDGGSDDVAADTSATAASGSTAMATTVTAESGDDVAPGSSGDGASESGESSGGPTGFADVYDLEGDTLFPEGIAFDDVNSAFFVGSLGDGTIHRIGVDGTQTLHAMPPAGTWSSSGLKVDTAAERIWVCATDTTADMQSVWQIDLNTGDLIESVLLQDIAEGAGCNDVALDSAGRVYVSDPPLGVVHRLEVGGTNEVWAEHPDFAMEVPGLGLNGLAVTPDEQFLIVAKFTPQRLFRVGLDDPSDVVDVELSGDAFMGGTAISGCDGIVFSGDALYVTFAELVKRVEFSDDWSTGVVSTLDVPNVGNGLSTATVAGGAVYVVKSEVTAFVLGQEPNLPFQIVRVPQ